MFEYVVKATPIIFQDLSLNPSGFERTYARSKAFQALAKWPSNTTYPLFLPVLFKNQNGTYFQSPFLVDIGLYFIFKSIHKLRFLRFFAWEYMVKPH